MELDSGAARIGRGPLPRAVFRKPTAQWEPAQPPISGATISPAPFRHAFRRSCRDSQRPAPPILAPQKGVGLRVVDDLHARRLELQLALEPGGNEATAPVVHNNSTVTRTAWGQLCPSTFGGPQPSVPDSLVGQASTQFMHEMHRAAVKGTEPPVSPKSWDLPIVSVCQNTRSFDESAKGAEN